MAKRTSIIWHALLPGLIWKNKSKDHTLYLTFDDGPTSDVTEFVLSELASRSIKATFFVLGRKVSTGTDTLKRMLKEGHQIGNHTFNHDKGWCTSTAAYVESIHRTQLVLDKYNASQKMLFRPPYGRISIGQLIQIRRDYEVVMWSLMAYDFDKSLSPEDCLASLIRNTKPGDVIVFHDNHKSFETLKHVLPMYLDECLSKGFKFGLIR